MANETKPTTRMVLSDVMKPLAEALADAAAAREKRVDLQGAKDARALAADIVAELGRYEAADSISAGEESTKRLQRLRSSALELLARFK